MNADAPLSAQVAAALGGLGTTAAEIAAALENKGIAGRQRSTAHCPLANYLLQQFPEATHASVGAWAMLVGPGGDTLASPNSPPPCRDFIRGFDSGEYPNLVSS